MNKKKIKGYKLIQEYPNSKRLGFFEPYTTGEFSKYPEFWQPVYESVVYSVVKVFPSGRERQSVITSSKSELIDYVNSELENINSDEIKTIIIKKL